MKPTIFITRKLPDNVIQKYFTHFNIKMWDKEDIPVPRAILLDVVQHADGLITMLSDQIDKEVITAGNRLKVIANLAVGFDNIDIQSATNSGIAVCNTPDILTDTTADLTFSLLMATSRRLIEAAEFVKGGNWKSWSPLLLAGHDVHHKTIGIVGWAKLVKQLPKEQLDLI